MLGSQELLFRPITVQVFRESIQMPKLPWVLKTIKAFMEAIRRLCVVCLEHKHCTVFPHGTKQTGAFLDKWMQKKQFFIKLQGNMTLTAFYFYQTLYVLFSSLNHFSSCQKENKNKWTGETPKSISPSLHMATPISNLLSIQSSLYNAYLLLCELLSNTCRSHCPIPINFCPRFHYSVLLGVRLKVIYSVC